MNRRQEAEGERMYGAKGGRRWGGLVVVVGAVLAMGGCAVNQQAEVAKYRDILNADSGGEAPRLLPGEDLALLRAMLLANQNNEQLAISGEDFVQAWAQKDRAFSNFLRVPVRNTSSDHVRCTFLKVSPVRRLRARVLAPADYSYP